MLFRKAERAMVVQSFKIPLMFYWGDVLAGRLATSTDKKRCHHRKIMAFKAKSSRPFFGPTVKLELDNHPFGSEWVNYST